MLKHSLILIVILLTGCTTTIVQWSKSGLTQQQVNQDHYQCLKESQQQQSSAYVTGSGGVAQSSAETNQNLYNACMAAKGYSWKYVSVPESIW